VYINLCACICYCACHLYLTSCLHVHHQCVCFALDEEIGSALGMEAFAKTERFQKMNVGFGLDEGLANPTDTMTVFYGERTPYCEWSACCIYHRDDGLFR